MKLLYGLSASTNTPMHAAVSVQGRLSPAADLTEEFIQAVGSSKR